MSRTPTFLFASACVLALGVGAWMLRREPAAPPRDDSDATPRSVVEATLAHRTSRPRAASPETSDEPAVSGDASAPDAPGHFTVRVTLRATGAPAAGAKVVVEDATEAKHEATTDAAGVARVEEALPADFVSFDVTLHGYLPVSGTHTVEAGVETGVDVSLERATVATGLVLETDGRPLAGAHVTVYEPSGNCCTGPSLLAEATTGVDGSFRLDPMPAERSMWINVAAPRHVAARLEWTPARGEPVEVRLAPGAVLSGVVRDPDGEPVEGAEVSVRPTSVPDSLADDPPSFEATTDASGRYVFDSLPLGCTWSVSASEGGFADAVAPAGIALTAAHAEASCDLALRPGSCIELTVVDSRGDPVVHANVHFEIENGYRELGLDEAGRTSIRVATPGTCRLAVDAKGHPLRVLSVELAPGETKAVVARLETGVQIAGVVVDDAGLPVAGARIDVRDYAGEPVERWTRTAVSGDDGTFRVEGVPPGARVLDAERYLHERVAAMAAAAPSKDVRIVLRRLGSVTLTARVPEGAARPKRLSVAYLPSDADQWVRDTFDGEWPDAWPAECVVEFLPAGRWRALIRADGYALAGNEFEVTPGARVHLGDVMLSPALTLAGRVEDVSGRAIANEIVEIGGDSVATDLEGRFSFPNVPPGPVAIEAGGQEFFIRRLTHFLAADTPPLVITLLRGGVLRGRVRDAAGALADDVEVVLVRQTADEAETETRSANLSEFGAFREGLPAGSWSVVVKRGAATLATKRVEITEGGETAVEIVLPR